MLLKHKFLVVDFHAESRYLLVRTLQRKFPDAEISECDAAEAAISRIKQGDLSAIITHRTFDEPGLELVRSFRQTAPDVGIVMVSGAEKAEAACAAGADCFLPYDQWLLIGSVVEGLLASKTACSDADTRLRPAGIT
jgi:DNA-binding NarL/FixJ family response regulator